MVTNINAFGLAAAVCATGLVVQLTELSAAEDVTAWDGDARSAVRIVAGAGTAKPGPLRAGVEIRLARGWHTYWRYPGDAGVPPQFTFDGSRNVKHVEVLWPAADRINDSGGTSIGYSTNVVFPIRVIPQDAGKPVSLRLRLAYAICEKLCVPAEGRGELNLPSSRASQDAALAAAEARVPMKQALGEGVELSIRSVRREEGADKARVVVDLAGPPNTDLFVEGPTSQWALPVPTRMEGAPAGLQRFVFELDGAPTGESYRGVLLTLTAVAPTRAIEVVTRLD
jgi:DsbC/DsbD-like thiol-disulfide interchange protein